MHQGRTTLSKFLIQQLKGSPEQNDLAALLVDIAACIKAISAMTSKGMLGDVLGSLDTTNVQGETQKKLDVLSNVAFINTFSMGGLVAGLASEEVDDPQEIDPRAGRGRVSILRAPEGRTPTLDDYLRPGSEQLAAGYAIYGPATMMVITVGKGTHGFTLDREVGNFILTHPHIEIPADTSEFAINASNERFWEPPIQRYVTECKAGKNDVRGRDFNMRWIASMVAEVHRILMRGGVFMYPRDMKDPSKAGRLRLMYEANPMTMVVEQAGGLGSTGRKRILEIAPEEIHQRVPVILGSRNEVERIERYHQDYDSGADQRYTSPLFQERSLFAN
jgi:fructose-1,6-bisphosphatase I/sedoheptulose-1,7-bisphosphatase/fructose-1,6-bisphosphatase I